MKKILIFFMIFFVIITITIIIADDFRNWNLKLNKENLTKKIIQTNATAVASKVIVIDAGHGIPDEGAVGIYGTTEEAINLKITLKLQKLIEQSGGVVILTRSDENGIYSCDLDTIKKKKVSDIHNRVDIANSCNADIFVSIHLNKFEEEKYSGWQTFYQPSSEESEKLATNIQEKIKDSTNIENDRVILPLKGKYIMDHVKSPTVTVECGFLSNREEARLLEQDDYQEKIAWGIYMGIQEYFEKI